MTYGKIVLKSKILLLQPSQQCPGTKPTNYERQQPNAFPPPARGKYRTKLYGKKNIVDITRIMSNRYLQTEFEKTAKKLNLVWKKLKKIKFSLEKIEKN